MILLAIHIAIVLSVYFTGPAGQDQLERRRARRTARENFPSARVVFLLPSDCRGELQETSQPLE
jgi:hypothetical protein